MTDAASGDGFPCRRGDFVDCLFPFPGYPRAPGPIPRIVYVQSLVRRPDGQPRMLVLLTTSSPRLIRAIPRGLSLRVRETDLAPAGRRAAGTLGAPFVIDVHRFALLPPQEEWFPGVNCRRFVIARSDRRLGEAISRRYGDIRERYPRPAH